jgi:hypothetical protein
LWAHADAGSITLTMTEDAVLRYVWGDRGLAFCTCRTCGCTTHWENLIPGETRMAVNCAMADPAHVADLPVRHFDGADTWQYLD